MAMTEQQVQLVIAAQRGDVRSFERLFGEFYGKVFALSRMILRNASDAEDVLQEAFITAWRKLDTLEAPAAFGVWIQVIARNLCNMQLRRKNVAILLDAEQEIDDFDVEEAEGLLPAAYAERADLRERLGRIIDGLSDVQRQTIVLYYFNELSVDEIARVMECSPNTVKTRLVLARRAIGAEVEEQERKSGQRFYGVAGMALLAFGDVMRAHVAGLGLGDVAAGASLSAIRGAILGVAGGAGAGGAGAGAGGAGAGGAGAGAADGAATAAGAADTGGAAGFTPPSAAVTQVMEAQAFEPQTFEPQTLEPQAIETQPIDTKGLELAAKKAFSAKVLAVIAIAAGLVAVVTLIIVLVVGGKGSPVPAGSQMDTPSDTPATSSGSQAAASSGSGSQLVTPSGSGSTLPSDTAPIGDSGIDALDLPAVIAALPSFDGYADLYSVLTGYWVTDGDPFVGFFYSDGPGVEYGLFETEYGASGKVVDAYATGTYTAALVVYFAAVPPDMLSDGRPESTQTIYIDLSNTHVDGSIKVKVDNLGNGAWYTYRFGGTSLEDAYNSR